MENSKIINESVMLDYNAAMERVGGDEELLKEVARLFLDDCARSLQELEEAVTAGDAKRLEREAHTLKGSVANFGAAPVTDAAFALETMGRNQDLSTAKQGLQHLQNTLNTLKPELLTLANS